MKRYPFHQINGGGFLELVLFKMGQPNRPVEENSRHAIGYAVVGVFARGHSGLLKPQLLRIAEFTEIDVDFFNLRGLNSLLVKLDGGGDGRLRDEQTGPNLDAASQD